MVLINSAEARHVRLLERRCPQRQRSSQSLPGQGMNHAGGRSKLAPRRGTADCSERGEAADVVGRALAARDRRALVSIEGYLITRGAKFPLPPSKKTLRQSSLKAHLNVQCWINPALGGRRNLNLKPHCN